MMSAEECRAGSAMWSQRGMEKNISIQRATILLALSNTWRHLIEIAVY